MLKFSGIPHRHDLQSTFHKSIATLREALANDKGCAYALWISVCDTVSYPAPENQRGHVVSGFFTDQRNLFAAVQFACSLLDMPVSPVDVQQLGDKVATLSLQKADPVEVRWVGNDGLLYSFKVAVRHPQIEGLFALWNKAHGIEFMIDESARRSAIADVWPYRERLINA